MNQIPNDPTNRDAPWEEAMSRDFDARVRDLHEAPIDFTSVKGKAHKIRRNRRAAVAGGILGVAAIITPIAVLTNGGGNTSGQEPDFASPGVQDPVAVTPDYLVDGVWHQADGDMVTLDQTYDSAVLWDGQLVATRFDGEAFLTADVITEDGSVVETFGTTAPVVVNDAGTTIAWVDTSGSVMTQQSDDDAVRLGSVDLAAPGEGAWWATAITGGPDCSEEGDGCLVFLDNGLGEGPTSLSSQGVAENPVPGALGYRDATTVGGLQATYVQARNEDNSLCTGLYDLDGGTAAWTTCEFDAQQISPSGEYVVGLPAQYDGIGPRSVSILDATDGKETPGGRYAPEGQSSFVWSDVTWSDSNELYFSAFDGASWHLYSMAPDGELSEIEDPVPGVESDSPFVLVRR